MKLAKLSLAAIMAVGALSTVNATPMEEAIKGVDLNGYAQYRFEDAKNMDHLNKYEVRVGFTTPVQENVSLNIRATASGTNNDNQATSSSNAGLSWDRVNVVFTPADGLAVTAGKQYLGTPLDDLAGTAVKAVYSLPMGLTFAALYADDASDDQAETTGYQVPVVGGGVVTVPVTEGAGAGFDNIYGAGVIYNGKSGDMSFGGRFWYTAASSTGLYTNFAGTDRGTGDWIFVEAHAGIPMINGTVQYVTADKDYTDAAPVTGETKNESIRVQLDGTVSSFSYKAGYIMNDKDGGDVRIDGSAYGDNDLLGAGWKTNFAAADTDYMYVGAGVKFGKVGLKADYVAADTNTVGAIETEIVGQVSYAVTKKLSTYVRYSDMSLKDADSKDYFRFHAAYSF